VIERNGLAIQVQYNQFPAMETALASDREARQTDAWLSLYKETIQRSTSPQIAYTPKAAHLPKRLACKSQGADSVPRTKERSRHPVR